ncbi:MAG: PA domain-containing protein, partial [Solirubrobacteraceae bacterium]
YVGRGCPASSLVNTALTAPDPYLESPSGKIALLESGGDGFNGCSLARKAQRAFAAGAVAVLNNIGGDLLSLSNAGPDGGMPDIPSVAIQATAFNRMAGYVPNRVLSGTAMPAGWELTTGSLAANANVKPLAAQLGCATPVGGSAITPENCIAATNEAPIKIRTSAAHGLATGDRVTITGVKGNTAANGTFTVTVPASTTPPESPVTTVFTLDGSDGTAAGAYTGGGMAVQCAPGVPNCSVPATARADLSRFRSVANATDPVAGVQVKAANRWNVTPGQTFRAGAVLDVAERTAGSYEALVEWFDAGGVSLSTSTIQSLGAVTARAPFSATVTAPANAAKAGMKFMWTGAGAAGTAYADAYSFVPTGLTTTLKDNQGKWGEQKIVNFSANPPALVGTYQSPRAKVWPPPNDGVFMPRTARMFGDELAFTTWMTDGLRVLDMTNPSVPTEVAALLPPGVADPSPTAGAGPDNSALTGNLFRGRSWPTQTLITGVGVRKLTADSARLVLSDINGGLYV